MAESNKNGIEVAPLLAQTQMNASVFSNYITVTMQGTELYLDFFTLSPKPGDIGNPVAVHVVRVTLPIFQSKGLVSALVNTILQHQKRIGLLPDLREKRETDVMDVWSVIDTATK